MFARALVLVLAMPCMLAHAAAVRGLQAPVGDDTQVRSRLAHLAAAGASLRLSEVAEARRWLDAAPGGHDDWEWRLLDQECDTSRRRLSTEEWKPVRLAWSADGKRLAVAADDGRVRILDGDRLEVEQTIVVSEQAVYAARFSPDGKQLVACARDGMLTLWSLEKGEKIWEQKDGGEGLADCDFHPDGKQIAFCSWFRGPETVRGVVSLWNAESGERTWQTEFGVKPVVAIRFSPDGSELAVGTWDGLVGVWTTASPGEPRQMDFRDVERYSAIDDIGFSPDGTSLVAATKNGAPRIWNVASGEVQKELRGHANAVFTAAFSGDGQHIATGGSDGVVAWWDAGSGELAGRFMGHTNRITCLAVRPGSREIVTGSADHSLRLWSADDQLAFEDPESSRFVYGTAVSRDGRLLATGGQSPTDVTVWDLATRRPLRKLTGLEGSVNYLAFGPERQLVGGNWAGDVLVWDAEAGLELRRLEQQEQGGLQQCAYSPDGKWIAASTSKKLVAVWDAESGSVVRKIALESGAWGIGFSPDSTRLAFGTADGHLHVLSTGDWLESLDLAAGNAQSNSVQFSPDGQLVACGREDGTLAVCDVGSVRWSAAAHSQRIWSVAFHPDGKRLASGGADLKLRLWDVELGEPVLTLMDFGGDLYNLAFVPGGEGLVINATRRQLLLQPAPARK